MFLGNFEVFSSSENGLFDVLVLPAGEEDNDYTYNITIHVNVNGYEEGSTHLIEVKVFRINKNMQSEITYRYGVYKKIFGRKYLAIME